MTFYHKDLEVVTSRKELEVSLGRANNYPDLFMKSLRKFHEDTRNMRSKRIDMSREGFVTYIAEM
jgi:hypothetical protein